MNKCFNIIDKQIASNKGKNIFFDGSDLIFKFIDNTTNTFSELNELNPENEKELIDYTTDKTLEEFCRINQYYTFDTQAKNDLRKIYSDLFCNIKSKKTSSEILAKNHYQNLNKWLRKTNSFAEKLYSAGDVNIIPVTCSEYSAELQINFLNIDMKSMMEPVLDIGCGKKATLVKHLCKMGMDATGIDRFSFSENNLENSDWLEYNYGTKKWGTIISNLGFSNHFKHHHLREDGNFIDYAKTYMKLLKSLKTGGRFHYAPDLPFIEVYLDKEQFQIDKYAIGNFDNNATVITRLK